ncbi:cellulase-like family protein [Microbacterium sp. ZW T5_56]|uniref:cellulase-like family protein n=1 Tax=Microbacterium sp. ZW T5_56 TaxID=3378081 RepID=UPI003852EC2B
MLTGEMTASADRTGRYVPVPPHEGLPDRLTITLWDFSWYVRTGAGEPFESLDRAAAEAVERGYNTIRICAMPFLLFGSGLDTTAVELDRLGGDYAQNVRWYDVGAPTVIDGRAHLRELFEVCQRHGLFVILSSWEYQQSSSFAVDSAWWDALRAVDPEDRAERLAESFAMLIDFLAEHGLDDRIAFTELHNEVQIGHLSDGLTSWLVDDARTVVELESRLTRGLARFHELQPDQPVTVNYAHVPVASMRAIPHNIDVLVVHPYIYGVLDEVTQAFDLRGSLADFPRAAVEAAGILRADAPDAESWVLPPDQAWKSEATIVGKPEIFLHDWVDADAFDRFLYERYQVHRTEMDRVLRIWLDVAADASRARGIPLAFGEGWIGYTPLHGTFEEGPVGSEFCRRAVRESARVGAWGTIVCSNAAPHHPMWADVALQIECNRMFTEHPTP